MKRLVAILAALLFFAVLSAQSGETKKSDAVIVAAGTEIKVSVTQPRQEMRPPYSVNGKVVAPVRLNFVTAIPASSVANIRVTPTYQESGDDTRRHRRQLVNYMQLTSIVVGDAVYEVSTGAALPIPPAAGLDSEISFVLQQPLQLAPKSN